MANRKPVDSLVARARQLQREGQLDALDELCRTSPDLKRLLSTGEAGNAPEQTLEHAPDQSPAGRRGGAARDDTAHDGEQYATQHTEELSFLSIPQAEGELGRLGHYRVIRRLGAGGMGQVFLAEDMNLSREVALKVMLPNIALSPVARQRFLREAKLAAALEHDHVVSIYQVGQENNVPYLAMQLLKGESLATRLKRQKRLPLSEVLRIGRQMTEGLAAAHAKGLIHRDIKPDNIWLEGERGRVKILDFGLARLAGDLQQLTQTGMVIGTPAFMSPEQARGEAVDARSDLFSLGCVLYRMSTGELPFQGSDVISVLMALATVTPRAPAQMDPSIPEPLSRLIVNLLAKAQESRPARAAIVAEALEQLSAELSQQESGAGSSQAQSLPGKPAKKVSAHRLPAPAKDEDKIEALPPPRSAGAELPRKAAEANVSASRRPVMKQGPKADAPSPPASERNKVRIGPLPERRSAGDEKARARPAQGKSGRGLPWIIVVIAASVALLLVLFAVGGVLLIPMLFGLRQPERAGVPGQERLQVQLPDGTHDRQRNDRVLAGPNVPAAWQEYRPGGAGFAISMPGVPRRTSDLFTTATGRRLIQIATLQTADAAMTYQVAYSEIGPNIPAKALEDARNELAAPPNIRWFDDAAMQVGEYPGRRFFVEGKAGEQVRMQLVVVGERLYQISLKGPRSMLTTQEADQFFDSFVVVVH